MKNYVVFKNQSPEALTDAQAELVNFIINPNEARTKTKDFYIVFELAAFSSQVVLDRKEKEALYTIKQIGEMLQKIAEEN